MNNKVIKCGTLITGDGKAVDKNKAVWIKNGQFYDITNYDIIQGATDVEIIDASDKMVVPGAITHHTHGCTLGPLFPSAAVPVSEEKALFNLNRHLSQGTTTVCNVDGMGTYEETECINKKTSVNLFTTTINTITNMKVAEMVDGKGLKAVHRALDVGQMLEFGAVAVGEVGGGHTLGGGGQDYLYIPNAFEKKIGVKITMAQARNLKFAALGRYMRGADDECDLNEVQRLLEEYGIADKITISEAVKLIRDCVLPSISASLNGFEEGCKTAMMYRVPIILHNSAPSVRKIEEILLKYGSKCDLIAAHCNHDTFEIEEAVKWAKRLKELGAIIDVGTFDLTEESQQQTGGDPEYFDALIRSGVTDVISTDYNGGCWDGLYTGVSRIVKKDYMDIAKAVALCTGNVRNVVPLLAKDRGLIRRGFDADFVVTDAADVGVIKDVYIDGNLIY